MSPPAPRHILMTADAIGGVWTFAMELCAALELREIRVTLVTMGRLPDAEQRANARAIRTLSVVSTEYRLEWMDDCARDVVASGEFLLRLADRIEPDVVHANTFFHAGLPFRAPVLLTAHSCVATWWRACKGSELPRERSTYAGWIADAMSRASLLVAPTRAFLRDFESLHGRAHASRVIQNGRSIPAQSTRLKEPVILAAGRLWDEAKNIEVLCRAARGGELPVEIAGETASPDGRALALGNVRFLGRLAADALLRRMQRAAVFAAPAKYEPFGLSILEAALSGCALVLGDIPSLRELWDGVAVFVHPEDVSGWRRALSRLLAEPSAAARAGLRARAHARRYSAEAMARAYCEAYDALGAAGRRRSAMSGVAA